MARRRNTLETALVRDIRLLTPVGREYEEEVCEKHVENPRVVQNILVSRNIKMVVSLARRYALFGTPFLDLFSEGSMGLMEAAKRFDPSRGRKFITYAVWWVRAYIVRAICVNRPGRTLTSYDAVIMAKLKKAERTGKPHGLSDKVVERSQRNTMPVNSIDGTGFDQIPSQAESPDVRVTQAEKRRIIEREMVKKLKKREMEIVKMYFGWDGKALTYADIGEVMGISHERARQIAAAALSRLKNLRQMF